MQQRLPIFHSAMMLTGVNLLLRGSGTAFQIFLSRRIGAEGIGLLQLILSVGSLCLVAGMAGIRTTAMYLSAEELGKGNRGHISPVLRGCFSYSIVCSCTASVLLIALAPWIAKNWIGNQDIIPAIRLYAAFLPTICICGVMTGYFTAEGKILFLSIIEIFEQIISITFTLLALILWAKGSTVKSCMGVIGGSGCGALFCMLMLIFAKSAEPHERSGNIRVGSRILDAALPLALGDLLRAGISSAENIMVPKRLALNPNISNPLSAFGLMSGMVFPILMFPACILFGLCEILIPEMARCHASGMQERIRFLFHRSLWAATIFGGFVSGALLLFGDSLCMHFYRNTQAAAYIRLYAPLVPMLYCDAIVDAMTKGLGQQKVCVRYNILTSAMDVAFLFLLLPKYGLQGYYFSFAVTHAVNFVLSVRRLLFIVQEKINYFTPIAVLAVCWGSALTLYRIQVHSFSVCIYVVVVFFGLYLFGLITENDILWIKRIVFCSQNKARKAVF